MLIIGERINSTRTRIQEAIRSRDSSFMLKEAKDQIACGADYIDVNCAVTAGDEVQDIDWVISVIQSEIGDAGICIDSPNHLAIERGLSVYKGNGDLMINSITGEASRISRILPLAKKYNAKLIALTMNDKGMPNNAHERFELARAILQQVKESGFRPENLYFDPLIRPVSTEPEQAREFLRSIPMIKSLGEVKTVCGLSNVSFGLPNRSLINATFLSAAVQTGLDAAIIDPTDKYMISSLRASAALLGMDEYCSSYIKAYREGKLI